MALKQILGQHQTVVDNGGAPLQGGTIDVYEAGTTTRVSSYSNSGLTSLNANPVVLDVGKASIWVSVDVDIVIKDRDGNVVASEASVNPAGIEGDADYGLIPNGSFETDTDADDEPDGWTKTDETGSNNILDTAQNTDGSQSMRFTSTGSGGGNIVTTDFFPVNETDDLSVKGDLLCSVVDIRVIIRVEWYDSSQVSISNSDIYDNASSNPTSWTAQDLTATPPVNARFAKLRLIGADPSDATSGSAWFDNFRVFYPQTVSGVFDNVTVSGNSIITTNTNGDLNLTPNGTGSVVVGGALSTGGNVDVTGNITVSGTVDGRDLAADGTKLDGIETGADVTDTANVTAAGALMDSEVDADIKTLSLPANTTISAFGRTLVDDAAASNARTTLGLGSLATASSVNNDDWSGTDLAVANGGTGSSTASAARTALGIGSMATRDVTIQNGGSPSGGSDGDVVLIY